MGGIKGGVGKSTLASNLAVLAARDGKDVLLVDGDSQETTMTWAAARGDREAVSTDRVTTVALVGKGVRDELRRLKPKYDTIVIDAGARDTTTQRSALTIADVVLLPFAPRGPDLWTIDAAVELISEIRAVNENLRALALVNRADPIGNDNAEAEAAFAEHAEALQVVPGRVGNRKAIAQAHLMGLAAAEMVRADPKAVAEMDSLYRYVFSTEITP
ncbi:chromosome partitioning protein ParA [Skermanella aerolata]|uniref:Chromosome partitioning protein ParA n=1 Tax=Skermanella aerolata TaxID=393310 RepID=A0A512E4K3_9PROT|nr:chromosome partitioning protein ParA [Skermanella aerolata]